MDNEQKLLDAQSLLQGYQWGLERAKQWGGPAAIEAAEKGILAMQERIVNLQNLQEKEEDEEPEEWDDHLDGPSPSFVIYHSDPSIEWTASDFE